MLVERYTDAKFANHILNSCDVRFDIADTSEGFVDVGESVANPDNVLLCGEHGGFMYFKLLPGVYEVHSFVLRRGRGSWALAAAQDSLSWIFTRTDAYEVLTRIPDGHAAATGLATKCGLRHEFSKTRGCKWRGLWVDAHVWGLRMQDWISRAEGFEEIGRAFHARLNEIARQEIDEEPHADDATHNRYLGASLAMLAADRPQKAVFWYNRWAIAARHKPVMMISDRPVEIAMDIGVLRFIGTDFELLRPS